MLKSAVLLLSLMTFARSIHFKDAHQNQFPFGRVTLRMNLRANNSGFLTRCPSCAPAPQTDPAAVQEVSSSNPLAIWTTERFGDKIAFKADNGKYLALCDGCWGHLGYNNGVFVSVENPATSPGALWIPEQVDGKWAFRSDSLETYLGSCVGCVFGVRDRSYAFVHMNRATSPPAQWVITRV